MDDTGIPVCVSVGAAVSSPVRRAHTHVWEEQPFGSIRRLFSFLLAVCRRLRLHSAAVFLNAGVVCILLSATAGVALGQRDVRLDIILPSNGQRGNEAPTVRSERVLSDSRTRDLLRHGFPARLHYRLGLWSTAGWFDDEKATAEWDVIVRFTPLDRRYTVTRIEPDRVVPLGTFDDLRDVEAVIGYPHRPSIRPPTQRARHYYNLVLSVEMLSVNDLDEVERWLRGELRPAVRGNRNPGTALTRGVRSLLVGLLGGENRKYETRTGRFLP